MRTRTLGTAFAWAFAFGLVVAANAEAPPDRDNDGVSDISDICPDNYGSGDDGCPTEDDIEEVTVTGERVASFKLWRGGMIDCTQSSAVWSALCSPYSGWDPGVWTPSGEWLRDPPLPTCSEGLNSAPCNCPAGKAKRYAVGPGAGFIYCVDIPPPPVDGQGCTVHIPLMVGTVLTTQVRQGIYIGGHCTLVPPTCDELAITTWATSALAGGVGIEFRSTAAGVLSIIQGGTGTAFTLDFVGLCDNNQAIIDAVLEVQAEYQASQGG